MERLIITPKTKIYDLLETYPHLEDTLIEAAPQFVKLKNPILRRTIARVTSLSQASIIGGLKVEELVNTLRKAAGQQLLDSSSEPGTSYQFEKPDWFSPDAVTGTIDINEMLNAGEQPVSEVLASVRKLKKGEILEIHASFIPAPLLDKATGLGYEHWIDQKGDQQFRVCFTSGS